MPAFFLDTPEILPLPSLQAYTTISVLLLSCSVWYAFQVTSEPDWKLNATLTVDVTLDSEALINRSLEAEDGGLLVGQGLSGILSSFNETSIHLGFLLDSPVLKRFIDVLYLMLHEPLCVWTLINMAYCCLILLGKVIQTLVFGELRVSEQQHMKDRFWNFIFYKFIFIFGVMNVQSMDEVVLWVSWFSILGFLTLLAQLCKDRFEYLSFSPMTPKWTHFRLLLLLSVILASSFSLFVVCIVIGLHAGLNTFAFMAAECSLVAVRTLYVSIRYAIHLWDLNHEGVWENRASYAYFTELVFELALLFIDFFHHLHMLFWGNIILSVASLVILMQLRYLFFEINRRIRKHKNYLQVVRLMEANFPMATTVELEKNSDDCAICWDKMEAARKLPCSHLFHNSCLRSWLEQDTSCPTCRTSLKHRTEEDHNDDDTRANGGDRDNNRGNGGRTNFFHFEGPRYASWLPSISVEVTRPLATMHLSINDNLDNTRATHASTISFEEMSRQIQITFPHVPLAIIIADLRITRSMDLTAENILEGRIGPYEPEDISRSTSQVDNFSINSNSPSGSSSSSDSSSGNENPFFSISSTTVHKTPLDDLYDTTMSPASSSSSPSTSSSTTAPLPSTSSTIISPIASSSSSSSTRTIADDHLVYPGSRIYGSSFSESPSERQSNLGKRRIDLLTTARKKYLSKTSTSSPSTSFDSNQTSSSPSQSSSSS